MASGLLEACEVLRKGGALKLREVKHREVGEPPVAQGDLLQLTVVRQPAEAGELDQNVGTRFEGFDKVAKDPLEGCADLFARLRPSHLFGIPGGSGQREKARIKHVLGKVAKRRLVIAVAEEGDRARARVTLAFLPLAHARDALPWLSVSNANVELVKRSIHQDTTN